MDLPTGDFDSLEPCCFAGEVLPVDDLLDLDIGGLIDEEESDAPTLARKDFLPSSSSSSSSSLSSEDAVEDVGRPSNCFRESPSVASCSFGQGHEALYHPPDELAELDWLSSFVDDSYTMEDKSIMPLLSMSYGELEEEEQNRAAANKGMVVDGSPFARSGAAAAVVAVAKAARSKRARSGGRVWAMQMQALRKGEAAQKKKKRRRKQEHVKLVEEDGGSESSSCVDVGADEQQGEAGKRKGRKRKAAGEEAPRRCSHCQVQKTPQWRAGPCGPKSLCNACGVRYKSGRLLPEYRPAASPTFLTTVHSNSHKRVLEMRRLKLEEPTCEIPL